jgi:tyrosyl-tRNA synthetase
MEVFSEIIREEDLRERLEASRRDGRPLRVKTGFDPTAPDLHLGHTVLLRKMKHFQDLGHTVIFLIGDGTALIGDPTGRNVTRPPMTPERSPRTPKPTRSRSSRSSTGEDRDPLQQRMAGQAHLRRPRSASRRKYTVARILERDDFSKRYRDGIPISIHEFMYPLAQAYDSVALNATSNSAARTRSSTCWWAARSSATTASRRKSSATTPLLEGLDGVEKMSKSLGNYVGIYEPPDVMFRKAHADQRRSDVALLPAAHRAHRSKSTA